MLKDAITTERRVTITVIARHLHRPRDLKHLSRPTLNSVRLTATCTTRIVQLLGPQVLHLFELGNRATGHTWTEIRMALAANS